MEPKEESDAWLITTRCFKHVCILICGIFHPCAEKSPIFVHLGLVADIIVQFKRYRELTSGNTQYRNYKFAFSHLPVTKPLFRCGQILCSKLLYYDDVTTIYYWNNRQVCINVGTALVAIFRISFVANKDLWFHAAVYRVIHCYAMQTN